jgi:hypothetical protein
MLTYADLEAVYHPNHLCSSSSKATAATHSIHPPATAASPPSATGPDAAAVGKRRLKNLALDYLMALGDEAWRRRALEQVPVKKIKKNSFCCGGGRLSMCHLKKKNPALCVSPCYDVGRRRVQCTNTYISVLISVEPSSARTAAPAQVY